MSDENMLTRVEETLAGGHWTKGRYYEAIGERYCLVGALRHVMVGQIGCEEFYDTLDTLAAVVRREFPDRVRGFEFSDDVEETVIEFNDDDLTDWPDIEAVLGKAKAEREGAVR